MSLRLFIVNAFIILFALQGFSQSTKELNEEFNLADKAYHNQEFDKAIQHYQTIINAGYHSAELYNNMGLTHVKSNNLALAIWSFERALLLDKQHEQTLHNLNTAKLKLENPITPFKDVLVLRIWKGIRAWFQSNTWTVFFILLWSLCSIAAYNIFISKKYLPQSISLGAIAGILAFVSISFAIQNKALEAGGNYAIVLHEQVGLRAQQDISLPENELIYSGEKVYILTRDKAWMKVQLGNGFVGWVPREMLKVI